MIRGITFDWWHTIAETPWRDYDERMREIRVRRVGDVLESSGVRIDAVRLFDAYDRHTDLLRRRWAGNEDLTAEEQVEAFLEYAGVQAPDARTTSAVREAFGGAIRSNPPRLYPHIAETLAGLKAIGLRVGLVSNTGRTWGRVLRPLQDDMGIGRYFDARIFSDEVRVRKPNRRIFETALEGLDLDPGETVHIGDDVDADIAGAKAAGMRAVWFDTGFWPDANGDHADAEIHDHAELQSVLARWGR